MSSAICFNLYQSKILSSGNGLCKPCTVKKGFRAFAKSIASCQPVHFTAGYHGPNISACQMTILRHNTVCCFTK